MPATRRHLLTAPIGLGLPFIRRAAAARRSLTFAAFGRLFQDMYEPAIVAPFVAARPDTEVFWYAIPSSMQALATLRRQRERPEIDVVLLDVGTAWAATSEGLLEPLTAGSLPILADLDPGALFANIAGPAVFTEPLVMLFDTTKGEPPPFWKLLWGRLEEREIAVPAPPDPIGIAFAVVAGRLFSGGDVPRMLQGGIAAIAQLGPRIVTWDPRPDVYHFVAEGNARYGVGWNMMAQIHADRMAGRLGVAFPEEGTISRIVTINLVKGARQPEAARQFIAHALGPDAQKTMVERMYLGPVNAKALYLESALLRTANTPARVARAMPVDWIMVNGLRDPIVKYWREVVPSTG